MGSATEGFREALNARPHEKTAVKHIGSKQMYGSKKGASMHRAPMGYRDGGKIKGFMPCSSCKTPQACKAAGCMARGMKNGGMVKGKKC